MRYYLGVAKDKGVSEGAIREAMAAAVATNGGRPRAQAREALKGCWIRCRSRLSRRGAVMTERKFDDKEIKEAVRQRYARAVQTSSGTCCGPAPSQPVQIGAPAAGLP